MVSCFLPFWESIHFFIAILLYPLRAVAVPLGFIFTLRRSGSGTQTAHGRDQNIQPPQRFATTLTAYDWKTSSNSLDESKSHARQTDIST